MNRTKTNLTRIVTLLAAISFAAMATAARPPHPAKFPKPKQGMGRYAVVLWEAGTPVPGGDGKKHMGKITEPDFVKLGGMVLYSNTNRRVVDLPVKEAGKLKKHNAVSSMQRLWMGEPYEELAEPPEGSNVRLELETESDTNLTWGPKAYQYDGSGNIRGIGPDSFTYDTAGRLIQSTVGGKTESFKYDAFGNLIEKVIDGANPVTIPVDGASNRIIGVSYDAKGNVTTGKGRTFTYDAMNMLSADSGNGGRDMVYDADDERIGVNIDTQLSRWWIRDFKGKVIREYQGQANEQIWFWEQDWIYGEGQLVGGERVEFWWQNEENGRTYTFGGKRHYHLDHLGSVRMVTDDSGRSVSEHDYYAFGVTPTKAYQEQINWGDPHIDAMRFAGHQREFLGFINTENTDYLDYMHARYYDPNLGRFLSVDPAIGSVQMSMPQSWNRYSYVMNNPLAFIDPTGASTHTTLNGTVVAVYDDGNTGVYRHKNLKDWDGKETLPMSGAGVALMGTTRYWDEFRGHDNKTGAVLDQVAEGARIQYGKSFDGVIGAMHNQASEMGLPEVAEQSRTGGLFDIKNNGTVAPFGPNTGRLLNGEYASARSAGNFLAGYNAAGRVAFETYMKLAGSLHQKKWSTVNAGRVAVFGTSFGPPPWYGEIEYAGRRNLQGYNFGTQ